jgi:hypothetical protein
MKFANATKPRQEIRGDGPPGSLQVALGISLGAEVQTVKVREISHISRQTTS